MTSIVALLTLAGTAAGPVVAGSTGQLDPTFAAATRRVDLRGTDDIPSVVMARPNGRLVVGGASVRPGSPSTGEDATLAQLTVSGAPDPGFGDAQGHVILSFPGSSFLLDAVLAADGRIVGIAATRVQQFLFRLNADGTLDSDSDGDPTSHFGQTGIIPLDLGLASERWGHVAVQADGSVIVAGSVSFGPLDTLQRTSLVRFTPTGVVDPSFGPVPGSPVIFTLGDGDSQATALAISPTGDSVAVAINAQQDGNRVLGLAKLHRADGSFDNGFSQDGRLTIQIGQVARADAVIVQSDGRIVLGGTSEKPGPAHPVILRYTPGGALDPGFGNGGVFEPVFAHEANLDTLRLTSAGNVVALTGGFVAAIRLTAAGRFDPGFDRDGRVSITISGRDSLITSGTLAPGDRPVLLSEIDAFTDASDLGVTRLTSAGKPDTTFAPAGAGLFGLDEGETEIARGVAVMPNGKIVTAATANRRSGNDDFAVLRLTRQGYPDHGFDGDGWAIADFGSSVEEAHDIALSGGTIVAAGCTLCEDDARFAVARFTRRGAPDTSFSGDGKVTTGFGPGSAARAEAIAVQVDGKIVVAGTRNEEDFVVARYTPAGVLDHTFSGNGKVTTDIDHGSLDRAFDVAVQGDGKIVVVGTRLSGLVSRLAIVRYTADGIPDETFGTHGIVTTDVGSGGGGANAVAIRADGRIIVAGSRFIGRESTIAIARYRPNGSPDLTFSGDGQVTDGLGAGDDRAFSVIATSGDRILFAGVGIGGFLVGRYLANGTLDPSFNGGAGFAYTQIGTSALAEDMAIAPNDGRIVLAGSATAPAGDLDVAVARYQP